MKRLLLLIVLVGMMQSCAKFKPAFRNEVRLEKTKLKLLDGKYEIHPFQIDTTSKIFNPYRLAHNLFEELERPGFDYPKNQYVKDTANYLVELKIEPERWLLVNLWREKEVIVTRLVKYSWKEDGYIYLDNDKTQYFGLPYVFGGIDIHKTRMSIDQEKNLVLEVSNFRGGAIFLVGFLSNGRTVYRKKMRKVE